MGTNYYYESVGGDICSHCGRGDESERLHIGKSSMGWTFSLHIIPERNLNSLAEWHTLWSSGGQIRDEYGNHVTVEEMLERITKRSHPTGLRRHGDGNGGYVFARSDEPTWDLREGEFS